MPTYNAPLRDMRFVMNELLAPERATALPGLEDFDPETWDAILEEGAKFAQNVLLPLNLSGDAGCTYENGVVRTPEGFKEAYDQLVAGGWPSLAADPEHGGQGAPEALASQVSEMFAAANLAFNMYPGLSHGAYMSLDKYGTPEQKAKWLPAIVDGRWAGTMCLTEPHCGTDLGLIRSKAVPQDDGSYRITGGKIFISAGEHDLTENIVHLVLARTPDAPEGTQGISMFIVPKFLVNDDGSLGARNGVRAAAIEKKMGIHGSATAQLNFDDAVGYLVGDVNKGMRAMFVMMNGARLAVGIQGLAQAEVSYQNALSYAAEREQGRALTGAAQPDRKADSLLVHPDVRRNLLTMRAYIEGSRALASWVGVELDKSNRHPDDASRSTADDFVALMTPILKSFLTDMGSEATNIGLQVYGGHGYIHGHGMEQFVRDVRIAQIYEGANGVQALDLVGRKMGQGTGRLLRSFFHPVAEYLEARADDEAQAEFTAPLAKAFGRLQRATGYVAQAGLKDPNMAGAASKAYLDLFAHVVLAYLWARMAEEAASKVHGANGEAGFYQAKLDTARFYFQHLLPRSSALFASVMGGGSAMMDVSDDAFLRH